MPPFCPIAFIVRQEMQQSKRTWNDIVKYIILTKLRYYLIFCDVQHIQSGSQL